MSSKKLVKKAAKKTNTNLKTDATNNNMTAEQLKALITHLKEENESEKEQSKIAQAEREKYQNLCKQTTSKLEEARAELADKERKFEEITKAKDRELAHLKQQLNGSEYESEIQSLKRQFDDDISKTKKEFADQTREYIHALRQQFHEDISKAKSEFKNETKQVDLRLGRTLKNLREEVKLVEYEADIDMAL